ncbi:MAG: ribonuclease D [Haliangiales bacterium]
MSDHAPSPVSEPDQVADIRARIAAAGVMAFDVEFASEGRFIPELSLIQVAWPGAGGPDADPEIAVIDCLAVDPEPIVALVGDPAVETVIHAARQDLGLVNARYKVRGRALWDTQIAAAFVGLGEQVGYAHLVDVVCGVNVPKDASYAKWLKRPLTSAQLRYAANDVRYLLKVWRHLRAQLSERGRLDWVRAESDALAEKSVPHGPAEDAYLAIKGGGGLKGKALARLRDLAAWRQQQALRDNRPLSWILPDKALLAICRRPPKGAHELRQVPGLTGTIMRRYGDPLLAALAQPVADLAPAEPSERERGPSSQRGRLCADIILALLRERADELGVARRFLGTRDEVEAVAAWFEDPKHRDSDQLPPLPLFTGWRHQAAGADVAAWLRGQVALACRPGEHLALAVVPMPAAGATDAG